MPQSEDFIDFVLRHRALRFGRFTLKSGHHSAYFFDSSAFYEGAALHQLGGYYADIIIESGLCFELLFGPAYKGIPLAAAVAAVLAPRLERPIPFCHDRKEAKDHGEGGLLSGADPAGRTVLLIDDVLTAGTSARRAVHLLRAAGARPVGLVVALDRRMQDVGGEYTRTRLARETHLAIHAVADRDELAARLAQRSEYREQARLLGVPEHSGTPG